MVTSGIDKTYITGIFIESIDFEKLNNMKEQKPGKIRLECDPHRSFYYLKNGDSFEYIRIQDSEEFKSFTASYKLDHGVKIQYAQMELSISNNKKCNKDPLSIASYKNKLVEIFDYLNNVYGIKCILDNVKFKTIELNVNIRLDYDFKEYVRLLKLLIVIAPDTYKLEHLDKRHGADEVSNIVLKNKSIQVKFYNKSLQLKNVYKIDDDDKQLLRIEYTLLDITKIKNIFGTNYVNDLSDKQIRNFIIQQFNKDFIVKYDKLKRKNKIKLKELIKKIKSENKNWISKLKDYLWNDVCTEEISILLDIEDFLELVKIEDKSNYAKNKRRILNDFPQVYFNQHEKFNEIVRKVNSI